MNIPRRIIQTGKHRELPLLEAAAAANLKLLHPDWDYVFFDDDAVTKFINEEFPRFRATFETFPYPIQRFDFFRYLAVFKLGGFYFDLDVFLASSLGPLCEGRSVFPFEELTISSYMRRQLGMDWELGNYAFGAAPGDPFLGAVIENCARAATEPADSSPMLQGIPSWAQGQFLVPMTTGPGVVSRTLGENPSLQSGVTVLFPHDVCDASTWHRFGDFGVHMMQASWRKRGHFLRTRIARLWENRQRERLLQLSRSLGPRRPGAWTSRLPATAGSR